MLNFMPIVYKTHNSVDLTNGQKIRRHLTENADFFFLRYANQTTLNKRKYRLYMNQRGTECRAFNYHYENMPMQ